jgi:DNA-binding GntR family transcriptional regulator
MTLNSKAYKNLKHRIITNQLETGTQLYEKELMQGYGIGRSPMRKIFHDLQRDGLLEILPKLGTKIVSISLKKMSEMVQLRRELEGFAAELATHNITPHQLERFRQLLDDAAAINKDDPAVLTKMSEIDMKIHQILYDSTYNEELNTILRVLLDKMTMYWFQVGFSGSVNREHYKEPFDVLEKLYRSLIKGDAAESKKIMRSHVNQFAELIKNQIFERNV